MVKVVYNWFFTHKTGAIQCFFAVNTLTDKRACLGVFPAASVVVSDGALVSRVTPTFTRNQVTLKKGVRELVGQDGRKLSQKLSFPYYTIEHWRTDMNGWWEYCLVQPNKAGKYISTWRIRPVAVLKDENHRITRVWGGFKHYCLSFSNCVIGVLCWGVIFVVMAGLNG